MAQAGAPPAQPLTLENAIDYASAHYPAVHAALEQVNSARSSVALARTSYLPQLNPIYQANRATQNQLAGIFFPSPIAPSIEGPVQPYSATTFWNTQGGALLSWEPFDFGLRRATVGQARSAEQKSNADVELTRLQVASATGSYFVNSVSGQQAVVAAQANVRRWEVFDHTVRVLVEQELRPGVDASRADAELAAARTQLFLAQAAEQQARALLASLLGAGPGAIQIEPSPLLTSPPNDSLPATPASAHPLARDQQASVEQLRAQQHVLERTDYPRLFLASEVFARGSGANPNGTPAGGLTGLGLSRGNWVAGISLVFPNLFDFSALRDQKRMAQAQERSQEAKYDQTLQDVSGQIAAAQAGLAAALQVAKNTPIELEAARQAETQARARYQSGLTNLVEVADAEGLLAQAERDDALARIGVWRALFNVAVAQGNLEPFLALLHSTGGTKKAEGSGQ
jgi:outer membrane protein TolC